MEGDCAGYIEIFHSKPSWRCCFVVFRTGAGTWSPPGANALVDAGHVRAGFRVHRMQARAVEFALTNGTARQWEDNGGAYYRVSEPGRYVVEHGIRRVGDADAAECKQALARPADAHVQLRFLAPHAWGPAHARVLAAPDGGPWDEPPGRTMALVARSAAGNTFEATVPARRLEFAFSDGAARWDSNLDKNYRVGLPGKYSVAHGVVSFLGPADRDLELEKQRTQAAPAPGAGQAAAGTPTGSPAGGALGSGGDPRAPVGAQGG